MKKLLVTLAAVLISAATAFAQGSVTFNNRTSAGDAPIFASDGVTGAGSISGIIAELDLVTGTTSLTYTPVGTTPFRGTSGALANFIQGVDLTVPGVAAGAPANFVVRAYVGSSYDAATTRGQSGVVAVPALGGAPPSGAPPVPTPDLSGLQSFTVAGTTPEPSTIALGVLGAAALLLRRRK
ncbi:MAG TPA: PEP-CTERM sorting domain-containing protein [Verrucomicrobiae bacterium]|jgi:hypothetical protein|nr:PEP-CTERM sorting domain-containing protein [Verrucomicrobiae bacterium]